MTAQELWVSELVVRRSDGTTAAAVRFLANESGPMEVVPLMPGGAIVAENVVGRAVLEAPDGLRALRTLPRLVRGSYVWATEPFAMDAAAARAGADPPP